MSRDRSYKLTYSFVWLPRHHLDVLTMEAHNYKSSVFQVHSVAIATMHSAESLLSRPPGSTTIRTSQEGLDVLQSFS